MMTKASTSFFLLLIFCLAARAQSTPGTNYDLVSAGMQAPAFKYEVEKGKSAKSADLKGRVVLINFFATWCGPCRTELPKIQSEIWDKHRSNPKFVMLTFGREHNWQEVVKFGEEQKLSFPLYPDPSRGVYGLFAKQTIPRSYLVDEEGKIIYSTTGYIEKNFSELVSLINNKLQ